MQDMEIDHVQFTTFDRYEISKGLSAVEVFLPSTVVIFERNNTLHDSRMGAFKNITCSTCKQDSSSCPGHMGHIKLCFPVINPHFAKTILKKILDSFCFACFNLIKTNCTCYSKEPSVENKKRKLNSTKPTTVSLRITNTSGNMNSGLEKLKFFFHLHDTRNNVERRLFTKELYDLIVKIPKSNYLKLFPNFNNFTDLSDSCFIHNLPVIPTICRPPNKVKNQWFPHHITNLYSEIIKKNIQLQSKNGIVHSSLLYEYHAELQNSINTLFDMNLSKGKKSQTVIENGGFRQRIDGKTGRIRGNLMGKRVDFSARTVLSGDPYLGINEIGIPTSIAENLTIPIHVNQYNIEEIKNGKYNLKYIFKDGKKDKCFDLSVNNSYEIQIGDIVERSLINGDIVAVNRQPTLHRGSMVACYVRIFPCSTLRMNYSTMIPLNADTDGDELNVHVPQDLVSRAELENLMLASTNIVCSQNSEPLIGLSQDSLLGCYLMSKELISENDFFDILYKVGCYKDYDHIQPDILKPKIMFSGLKFIDFLLDYFDINIQNYQQKKAGDFLISNNKVIRGILNKYAVGTSDNTIIHQIYLRCGHIKAANFIFALQKIANEFLNIYGFSVGVSDCIIEQQKLDVEGLNKYIERDLIQNNNFDEEKLLDALAAVGQLEPDETTLRDNRMIDMIKSGSKGSMSKFMQITSFLGQQFEESGRIKPEFNNNTRVLPHFKKFDLSIESRGFVKNSFIKGLSPTEFFLHSVPSRITLIDTACKTSVTGAQYRRLVKCLERAKIREDHLGNRRVIDSSTNNIIQFNYGEDDFQGEFMKKL